MKTSNQTNAEKTMDNFREYLKGSGHNIVAENVDCSSTSGFICESITKSNRFILKIRVDEKIQFAVLEAYAGISVPKPYRTMAAEYCNKQNDRHKVSYFCVSEQGDVYSHMESSFIDGPLSGKALEELEHIALASLVSCYDDFQQIARGVLLDKENDDKNPLDLLSRLRSEMGVDDEDDELDSLIPNSDIAEMLKQLRGEEEDEYNDEPDEETA